MNSFKIIFKILSFFKNTDTSFVFSLQYYEKTLECFLRYESLKEDIL